MKITKFSGVYETPTLEHLTLLNEGAVLSVSLGSDLEGFGPEVDVELGGLI